MASVKRRNDQRSRTGPAQVQVSEALRRAIFSGKLQPGDSVLEMDVARRHKVSQTTVREALAKLEHAGFVRRIPNQGTFVTKLSTEELLEHLRLRVVLESMAAAAAAERMAEEDFRGLDDRLQNISAAVSSNAYYELVLADLSFHRYVWERSGDGTLFRILEQIVAPLFAFISIRISSRHKDLKRVVLSHEPIVAALRARDPVAAKEAVRHHIEDSFWVYLSPGMEQLDVTKQPG